MAQNNKANSKLMIYRLVVLAIVAFLLVQLNIVTDTTSGSKIGLYVIAFIIALPVTMLLDKFIVRFAKTGSFK
jgi:hypothetical protein